MDSGTLNVGKIFGQERRYLVPLFQRPYVWRRETQWEPLWNDIRAVADRSLADKPVKPHFLGAVVLDQQRKPTGHMETRLVIDGQQRLTTVQLILEAFGDLCASVQAERYHKALVKLTRNDDPMSTDADEVFKVWPTNVDRDHFRRVMQAESPAALRKFYGKPHNVESVGHPVGDGYLYFSNVLRSWLRPEVEGLERRLDVLYRTLREQLRIVVIDLGNEDDAQVIFETLNARGTPLLPSDLVKNYLFHKAQEDGTDTLTLYKKCWQAFDEDGGYWRREHGRGHARRARIDLFLHNYLTVKKRDTVSVAHLYTTFREYAADPANGTPVDHLRTLREYADAYQGFDQRSIETREGLFFKRLEIMDVASAHAFLLELFAHHKDDLEEINRVLTDFESFLIRRMVCGLSTRGYNVLFVEMLRTLDGEGRVSEELRDFLLKSDADSARWPDDHEFRRAWTTKPVYETLVRARVMMILEALERQLHTGKTEKIVYNGDLQIEHLMPREWHAKWPLDADEDPTEGGARREALLHTIGNLTLLTSKLNPSVSNDAWGVKRKAISAHSALNLNRQLVDLPTWDEASIRARGETLFNMAAAIWPYPVAG